MKLSTPEQAKMFLDKFRLPENKACKDCSNYLSWCREVYAGSAPWSEENAVCAVGPAAEHFNVDFRQAGEFVKARKRQR